MLQVDEPPGGIEGCVVTHWHLRRPLWTIRQWQTVLSAAVVPSPMVQKGGSRRCAKGSYNTAPTLSHTNPLPCVGRSDVLGIVRHAPSPKSRRTDPVQARVLHPPATLLQSDDKGLSASDLAYRRSSGDAASSRSNGFTPGQELFS
ncbi:hypothetical protein Taro_052302 [Colocasia esculenta]|uniref:Uncharacterized protein n=1 Tax=Colocasia esculenta TaxID=4460 RepID=A0A843XJB0_COLES|nr:hypothetical protein [Colocasia esculenta]